MTPPVISLLTDYGLDDGFVGVLHSVVRALAPGLAIVDLTHGVRQGDVRAGSLALARAAPYLAPGVVVAVVDPGVGTSRRPVAARAAEGDVFFVGPDNGLLLPAMDRLGGPSGAVELRVRFGRDNRAGPTFDGRDLFAPAGALLASGHEPSDLGPPCDPAGLVRLAPPVCRPRPDGGWDVEVTWVDRFGNVELAATMADFGGALAGASGLEVSRAGARPATWVASLVSTFGELGASQLGALVDSDGRLALCLNGASAASVTGLGETDVVRVRALRPA